MAASIVAYEDYRTWLEGDGLDRTRAEFIQPHRAVRVRRSRGIALQGNTASALERPRTVVVLRTLRLQPGD